MGTNGVVDTCSGWYSGGEFAGQSTVIALAGSGAAAGAGRLGARFPLTWRGGEVRFRTGAAVPRFAPLGHRTKYLQNVFGRSNGTWQSRVPHYHARNRKPGEGGSKAHRPWEGGFGKPWRR